MASIHFLGEAKDGLPEPQTFVSPMQHHRLHSFAKFRNYRFLPKSYPSLTQVHRILSRSQRRSTIMKSDLRYCKTDFNFGMRALIAEGGQLLDRHVSGVLKSGVRFDGWVKLFTTSRSSCNRPNPQALVVGLHLVQARSNLWRLGQRGMIPITTHQADPRRISPAFGIVWIVKSSLREIL